jgi:hypothetical protein
MLVDDPDYEKTGFHGESLSFYGRWTYKEIVARAKGAQGLILIHTDESAKYSFRVVQTSWSMERIKFADGKPSPLLINTWIKREAFDRALKAVGLDYEALKAKADERDFEPFALGISVKTHFTQTRRTFASPNVIGILPGTTMKDECVIYTAHYDHFGIGIPDDSGDNIYNGALDNATGTSAIICLARAFAQAPNPPARSIVFFANTGEENGLLGSTHYAENPVFPLDKTAVVLNKDVVSMLGKRADVGIFPADYSNAFDTVKKVVESFGLQLRHVTVDKTGFAFRSDHFPFAGRGVVAMSVGLRGDNTSISAEEEKAIREQIGMTYHQPADEVQPLWRYDGALLELELLYAIGRHWADGAPKPAMNPENPFTSTIKLFSQGTPR